MRVFDEREQTVDGERAPLPENGNAASPPNESAEEWWDRVAGRYLSREPDESTHTITLTTDELIELAAYHHMTAEHGWVFAEFFATGRTSRDRRRTIRSNERWEIIMKELGEQHADEAIARGEQRLMDRWHTPLEEWHVYRCGPDDKRKALLERIQAGLATVSS